MKKTIPRAIKRMFDFVFAIMAGLISLPFVLIAMLMVKIMSPEDPLIFKQRRIGYKGKCFTILKLRTMTNEKDSNGNLLPDEARLRKWGRLIRAVNIDELMQIGNILAGQMSWIGPRPLLQHEMAVMTIEEQEKRQSMLPGITGWEAVNEEKSSTREAMAQYDLYYIENWSLWLDVKIFFKTAFIVLLKLRPDDSFRAPKMNCE